jgi:hypothetical protein
MGNISMHAAMFSLTCVLTFGVLMYLAWRVIRYQCEVNAGPDARGLRQIPLLREVIWLAEGLLSVFGYVPEAGDMIGL